jgi:hypothetical protein
VKPTRYRPALLRRNGCADYLTAEQIKFLTGGATPITRRQCAAYRARIRNTPFVSSRFELHRLEQRLSELKLADRSARNCKLMNQCAAAIGWLKSLT